MNWVNRLIKNKRIWWSKASFVAIVVVILITHCNLPGGVTEPEFLRNIVDETFTVSAGEYVYYTVKVSEEELGRTKVIDIIGSFTASGGSDNCIEVFFLDEENFWKADSGRPFSPIYESGRVSSSDISVDIFDTNMYYLVYSNTFCQTADKVVTTKVDIYNYN